MECALTLLTISAGLLLSIACAMLIEELFIGGLFRIFFAPRPSTTPARQQQARWGPRRAPQKQAKAGHILPNGQGR